MKIVKYRDWFSFNLKLFLARLLVGVHVHIWDRDCAAYFVVAFTWREVHHFSFECYEDLLMREQRLEAGRRAAPPSWRLTWNNRTVWEHLPIWRTLNVKKVHMGRL